MPLYLPVALSQACLEYHLALAAMAPQQQVESRLISYLKDYRLFIICGAYQRFYEGQTHQSS